MATFGTPGVPSQLTINYDALFAQSLFNYRKTLADNISNGNAFFYEMKRAGLYESYSSGTLIQEDLMYELTPSDSYSGYDTLSTIPPDGITAAFFEPRQIATPITYSEEERKKNKARIVDFVQSRIKQSEIGAIDFFHRSLLQGAGNGAIQTPKTSPVNGSFSIDPLARIIAYDPTASLVVGNINQSTSTWWRNVTADFTSITTEKAFLTKMDNVFNTCSLGPGGKPRLILTDQITWEIWRSAYYTVYRRIADSDNDYPFPNFLFNGTKVTWDPYVPDVATGVTSTASKGTAFFINPSAMKVRYEEETDFTMTKFQKPVDQDVKAAHILWMGQITTNNRRKLGVCGNIARSLS